MCVYISEQVYAYIHVFPDINMYVYMCVYMFIHFNIGKTTAVILILEKTN